MCEVVLAQGVDRGIPEVFAQVVGGVVGATPKSAKFGVRGVVDQPELRHLLVVILVIFRVVTMLILGVVGQHRRGVRFIR